MTKDSKKDIARDMYEIDKKSLRRIAIDLSVSHETVRNWLLEKGVPIRKKNIVDPKFELVRGLIVSGKTTKYIMQVAEVGRTKVNSIRKELKNYTKGIDNEGF